MITYLKNQEGYKEGYFKRMSYNDIRLIFERVWDHVNTFIPIEFEVEKDSSKPSERETLKIVEEEKVKEEDVNPEPVLIEKKVVGIRRKTLARGRASDKQVVPDEEEFVDPEILHTKLVMERFQDNTPEGYNLMLWGDLKILGSKRRRVGKEPESTIAPKEKTSKTIGKSTKGSKSHHKSADEFAQAEEPMQHIRTKLPTPDRDWNKTLPTAHGPVQPWLSTLAQKEDTRNSFNKLMDTPLDFSTFIMNRLKVDTLTLELLAGPTFKLMKGSCKKLQIVEWHNYKHLDWITVCRDNDKLYKLKEGDFKRLRIQDMLLLFVQGKLTNLTIEERLAFNISLSDLKQREAYTAYSNPKGFIYQNKDKKNRLMRIDELYKFSDGILNVVRTALDDRLKGIRMQYLPQNIWKESDRDKVGAMI
ncbi:hypothetical protein Tco_0741805 [Tanacetum coccineum]